MDAEYYSNARKWYNTMYVDCASERIVYFLLLVLTTICVWYSYNLIDIITQRKAKVETYVLLMDHKDPESMVQVQQLPDADNQDLSLLELLIQRYVINYESLNYNEKETSGTDALQEKAIIVRNLSGKDVYDNYMKNAYSGDDSDMSLALLKQQKIATIDKIEFIYDEMNIVEKIYNSISGSVIPHSAKVYFSTETTSENSTIKKYVATMNFNFFVDPEKKVNSKIEFKVNDYYKELIEE